MKITVAEAKALLALRQEKLSGSEKAREMLTGIGVVPGCGLSATDGVVALRVFAEPGETETKTGASLSPEEFRQAVKVAEATKQTTIDVSECPALSNVREFPDMDSCLPPHADPVFVHLDAVNLLRIIKALELIVRKADKSERHSLNRKLIEGIRIEIDRANPQKPVYLTLNCRPGLKAAIMPLNAEEADVYLKTHGDANFHKARQTETEAAK